MMTTNAKLTESPTMNSTKKRKLKTPKQQSLAALNAWMTADYDKLLEKAKRNCVSLTGRPTFDEVQARKAK